MRRAIFLTLSVACILAAMVFTFGCSTDPERRAASSNGNVEVNVLTRFDGITLYRVHADGRYIYVARATDNPTLTTRWDETEHCGDDCTRTVPYEVDTVVAR